MSNKEVIVYSTEVERKKIQFITDYVGRKFLYIKALIKRKQQEKYLIFDCKKEGLSFYPDKNPIEQKLYVWSGYDNIYFPADKFYECFYEHKINEFYKMLASIGAKSIKVSHESSEQSKMKGLSAIGTNEIEAIYKSAFSFAMRASLTFGKRDDSNPYCSEWIKRDKLMMTLYDMRVQNKVEVYNYEMEISQHETMSVQAKEAFSGLDGVLSVSCENKESKKFSFNIEFY